MSATTVHDAISKLEKTIRNDGPDAVRSIENDLLEVTKFGDPCTIGPLLRLLNDEAVHDEGMFSLIHAAEAFDDGVYAKSMLRELPYLINDCPKWASIVFMRALNSEDTKNSLVKAIRVSDEKTKEAVTWLSEKINERSPQFLGKTVAVMTAAKT